MTSPEGDQSGALPHLILVTGATGKIGKQVVSQLLEHGFGVRGLSSFVGSRRRPDIDWVVRDLRREDMDFSSEMAGVTAVVHLAAELSDENDMNRTNVEATAALARAAEAEGVRLFCFMSSVSVYGSAFAAESPEDSPLLTESQDVASQYWGDSGLRAYGRSKVAGESQLRASSHQVEYVALRAPVVVDRDDLGRIAKWSRLRRFALLARYTNHLFVDDLAAVVVQVVERSTSRANRTPGLTVFNVSDESAGTYADFFASMQDDAPRTGRAMLRVVKLLDWGRDLVRYRGWPIRRPLGYMSYPSAKLRRAGFTLPVGMAAVRRDVFR
jgi:nucleoside-diphosphate-sugar epimerase